VKFVNLEIDPPEIEIGSVLKESASHKAGNFFARERHEGFPIEGSRHVGAVYVAPRGTYQLSEFLKLGTHKRRCSTRGDPIV
jgi:hypothetical protein